MASKDLWDDQRQERLRELKAAQASLRKRLVLMVVTLVVVVGALFVIPKTVAGPPLPRQPEAEEPQVVLPPLDLQELAAVADSKPEERILLEPEPFAYLASSARALLPDHLRMIGSPALPFDELEARSAELRGKPFRLRGELLERRALTRAAGAPEEYWYRLRTDDGQDFFFATLRDVEDFTDNYFRADGYFFKIYTGTVEADGERITAPLLVGRQLVASYHPVPPASQVDFAVLADVRDATLGESVDLDQDALWQLLNVATTLRTDPAALQKEFEGAPELNLDFLSHQLIETPALYRGKPMVIPGQVLDYTIRYDVGQENPLRLDYVTHGYLGNISLNKQPVHLIAPGKFPMVSTTGVAGLRKFFGWFLQFQSAVDKDGNLRLYPVFVVADTVLIPIETPKFMTQAMIGFFIVIALLAGFIVFMAIRDRRRSAAFDVERDQRRKTRNSASTPAAPKA